MRYRKQCEHLRKYRRFGKVRLINKGVSGKKVVRLANSVKKRLTPYVQTAILAGSIRRKKPNPDDVDIVLIPKKNKLGDIKRVMHSMGRVVSEGDKFIGTFVNGTKVDLFVTNPESYGAQLYHSTGPGNSNIGRRTFARNKGLLLNEKGVFDRKTGKYLAGRTEKDVFKALGRPYKNPEDRG